MYSSRLCFQVISCKERISEALIVLSLSMSFFACGRLLLSSLKDLSIFTLRKIAEALIVSLFLDVLRWEIMALASVVYHCQRL